MDNNVALVRPPSLARPIQKSEIDFKTCKQVTDVLRNSKSVLIVIEGQHIYVSSRDLKLKLDYKNLYNLFATNCNLLRAIYCSNVVDSENHNPVIRLMDYLSYNNYAINHEYVDEGSEESHPNFNVKTRVVTDMFAYAKFVDHIILFGGSDQYIYTVNIMKKMFGIKFTAVSTMYSRNENGEFVNDAKISNGLRRECDFFIDLQSLIPWIEHNDGMVNTPTEE